MSATETSIERHQSLKQIGLYKRLLWLSGVPALVFIAILLLRFF